MLKAYLNRVHANLCRMSPNTADELIDIVHKTTGGDKYGSSFSIVTHRGEPQGMRVRITGRTKTHTLPKYNQWYTVSHGMEKYIKAGWKTEEQFIKPTNQSCTLAKK